MADPLRLVETYSLYIDGQWIEPRNGRYDDISPSTEETIAQAPEADVDDVDAAIGAARRAFDDGPWAAPHQRSAAGVSASSAMPSWSTPTTFSRWPRSSGAASRTSG